MVHQALWASLSEIGPGNDFALQLVLANYGAQVTLADKYLDAWIPEHHPTFYARFLQRWTGPSVAVKSALQAGSYSGTIIVVCEPFKSLRSFATCVFDNAQSHAVLENIVSVGKGVSELAHITKPGGIHAHRGRISGSLQLRPTARSTPAESPKPSAIAPVIGRGEGTAMRMMELIEPFTRYFRVWDIWVSARANHQDVEEIRNACPPIAPTKIGPAKSSGRLEDTSGNPARMSRFVSAMSKGREHSV